MTLEMEGSYLNNICATNICFHTLTIVLVYTLNIMSTKC